MSTTLTFFVICDILLIINYNSFLKFLKEF